MNQSNMREMCFMDKDLNKIGRGRETTYRTKIMEDGCHRKGKVAK